MDKEELQIGDEVEFLFPNIESYYLGKIKEINGIQVILENGDFYDKCEVKKIERN